MVEIHSLLVISTAHITESSSRWASIEADVPYGYFLHNPLCGAQDIDKRLAGLSWINYPEDIVNIFKFAAKHNCKYIYIDRDGPIYEELERFEW